MVLCAGKNIVQSVGNIKFQESIVRCTDCCTVTEIMNSLPDMPILDSSKLAANKDMMSKILTDGDTDF